ncbi:MAG TPA: SprT family zinc-dependent metalloprotease [Gammaproteobacteria bacterium]|nr:SprT family zinc-dependent metalloprotease [Gammaproteobacteria bacterium]
MPRQLRLLDDRLPTIFEADRDPLVVRESRRARRLFLQLVPPHTLELVVPVGTRPKMVEAFVREHADWISRARTQVETRYAGDRALLPASITLPAVGKRVSVHYRRAVGGRARSRVTGAGLELHTLRKDHLDGRPLLRRWLLDEARTHLKPWLLREADRVGRSPRKVQVRLQRTRWGSCSSSGNISLNASALFLSAPVVRYLMIHELCHLYSLNHSRRFWKLVEEFEPSWRALDRQLANAWTEIPLWVAAG